MVRESGHAHGRENGREAGHDGAQHERARAVLREENDLDDDDSLRVRER